MVVRPITRRTKKKRWRKRTKTNRSTIVAVAILQVEVVLLIVMLRQMRTARGGPPKGKVPPEPENKPGEGPDDIFLPATMRSKPVVKAVRMPSSTTSVGECVYPASVQSYECT